MALQAPEGYYYWGRDLDEGSHQQMAHALSLPISEHGALMPDAHLGYGLPIGGVLATKDAVIPYAVGVDIACRMRLTITDLDPNKFLNKTKRREKLKKSLLTQTVFGAGKCHDTPPDHAVLDQDWSFHPLVQELKDRAHRQLGSSGSGNHFAEWGILQLTAPQWNLEAGQYLALLSHSGSRGAGATIANHFSKLAQELHPDLPKATKHLAWLEMSSQEGQDYWRAMSLMGDYAHANHEILHQKVLDHCGAQALKVVENHHNFAWQEEHFGENYIVHRKGATPAHPGTLGIIPGSMTAPAFVVEGKGQPQSLRSCSHGAGRLLSRRRAKRSLQWKAIQKELDQHQVELIGAGLDEAPQCYKDIHQVMEDQKDLIQILATFYPKIVRMAS